MKKPSALERADASRLVTVTGHIAFRLTTLPGRAGWRGRQPKLLMQVRCSINQAEKSRLMPKKIPIAKGKRIPELGSVAQVSNYGRPVWKALGRKMNVLTREPIGTIFQAVIHQKITYMEVFVMRQHEPFISRYAKVFSDPKQFIRPSAWIVPRCGR